MAVNVNVEKVVEQILHLQSRWHREGGPLIQVDELRAILTRYRTSLIAEKEREYSLKRHRTRKHK